MRTFLYYGLALALLAFPAGAVEDPPTFRQGPSDPLLLKVYSGIIDTDNECLPVANESFGMEACDTTNVNEFAWPHDALISSLTAQVVVASDAAKDCRFAIEVAGTPVGDWLDLPIGSTAVADNVYEQSQDFLVEAGDIVGIQVDDGDAAAACTGTIKPQFVVSIFGHFVQQ